jgi:exonuclease SbcD
MFRFIHAADIHLDSPLRGLELYEGAPAQEIRGATRRALGNLIRLALEEEAAFVIIAGDLYDGDWKDYNTGLFFVKEMTRLREAGIPVVIVAGNHDAASRLTRDLRLPESVKLLSSKAPETVIMEGVGVAIHGQSFPTQAVTDDLAAFYPSARNGFLNVGVLHTALDGREGHAPYAPCSLVELETKGYDYWALGHVHRREVVSEDPHIVFPGNTQGRHARELGPKGASVVAADDGRIVAVTPAILDAVRWETCHVPASEANSGAEVLELVADRLGSLAGSADGRLLAVRVLITGRSAAHADFANRPQHWENQIRALALDSGADIWVEKVKFATETALDMEALAQRDDPVGSLIRTLRTLSGGGPSHQEYADVFGDLARRLPAEYGDLEDALDLRDPGRLEEMLRSVEGLLLSRLLEGSIPG